MKNRSHKLVVSFGVACLVLEIAVGCGGSSFTSSTGSGGASGGSMAGAPPVGGSAATGGSSAAGANAAGTAGSSATAGAGGTAAAGSSGSGGVGGVGVGGVGGGNGCKPACGPGRQCCGGQCVNESNDPRHCGACGTTCDGTTYCASGKCVAPPCEAAACKANTCCGAECCSSGMLCCDSAGPLDNGPHCTTPSATGTCPMGCAPACVCASPDTPIATPGGERAIATLHVGDLVYSIDDGAVKVVPLIRVNHTEVSHHHVMRGVLATGATLEISGAHPTADGRNFADLRAGTTLDGVAVVAVDKVPYSFSATYDILPGSSTGTYFAGGALIGSTLSGGGTSGAAGACVGAP